MIRSRCYELLISDPKLIKQVKTNLEETDDFVKPIYTDTSTKTSEEPPCLNGNGYCKVIRTKIRSLSEMQHRFPGIPYRLYNPTEQSLPLNDNLNGTGKKFSTILSFSKDYLKQFIKDTDTLEKLLAHVPDKYSLYPPLLLFNNSANKSFSNGEFLDIVKSNGIDIQHYFAELLQTVFPNAAQKPIELIAINKPIEREDMVRQPHNIQVLFDRRPAYSNSNSNSNNSNDDFWCEVKQNGVWQVWNPFHTMFSRGNIKEKKRILDLFEDVKGNDVVDLYCGIGYFSFSYMQLQCRYLFGFDLNRYSIEGFKRGLVKNKYFGRTDDREQIIENIHCEDNVYSVERIAEFRRKNEDNKIFLRIRHINLGLLPSSKAGWPIAIDILVQHNSWSLCPVSTLHIHENVGVECLNSGEFVTSTIKELAALARGSLTFNSKHLERIKTFAPDVWHVCLDVDVTLVHQ